MTQNRHDSLMEKLTKLNDAMRPLHRLIRQDRLDLVMPEYYKFDLSSMNRFERHEFFSNLLSELLHPWPVDHGRLDLLLFVADECLTYNDKLPVRLLMIQVEGSLKKCRPELRRAVREKLKVLSTREAALCAAHEAITGEKIYWNGWKLS